MSASTLWEALELGRWYGQYSWAIDSVVYLVLFTGIARVTVGQRFEGRGGTAISAATGVALTFAAATTAQRVGFSLTDLGPLAWLIVLLVLGVTLFDLLRRCQVPALPAIGVVLIALATTAAALGPALNQWLALLGLGLSLAAIGAIGLVLVVLWLVLRHNTALRFGPASSLPGALRVPAPNTSPADIAGQTVLSERATIDSLERLARQVAQGGCDARSETILRDIMNRKRGVQQVYQAVLRTLAQQGWRTSDRRDRLSDEVRTLLAASQENIELFRKGLDVAVAAHDAGNVRLVLQAAQRMLFLEREAFKLARMLQRLLERLRQPQQVSVRA